MNKYTILIEELEKRITEYQSFIAQITEYKKIDENNVRKLTSELEKLRNTLEEKNNELERFEACRKVDLLLNFVNQSLGRLYGNGLNVFMPL